MSKGESSTCALDLNASTAESLERMSSTSVSSAPICRPQPIPLGTVNIAHNGSQNDVSGGKIQHTW